MLRPDSRTLMLEALRPPRGYELDRAIGTTFSLDLLALLTAPLAFTFFDWEDEEGRPTADPLALVQAARRYAFRIHLFCQAGRILVPPHDKLLVAYLEESVFEVRGRQPNALFHPKVWLLRYRAPAAGEGSGRGSEDGSGKASGVEERVRYRFLCFTRNLTFARSWDTALVLDGRLTDRKLAFSRNHPLGDLFAALPELAIRAIPERVAEAVELMQDEVRRVRFEPPEGFDEFDFWPLGIRTTPGPWPFPEPDRRRPFLAVSPFVDPRFLERFGNPVELQYLISRPETLGTLDLRKHEALKEVWALSPYAELDSHESLDEEAGTRQADDQRILSDEEEAELAGLHAKLYVMDDGHNARVWTGSANATEAGFRRNVEFLVELRGRKSKCGIGALLGSEEDGLRGLLQPHDPASEPDDEPDQKQRRLEAELERLRDSIVDLGLGVRVAPVDGPGDAGEPSDGADPTDSRDPPDGDAPTAAGDVEEGRSREQSEEGRSRRQFHLFLECPSRPEDACIPEAATVKTWPVTLRQEQLADLGSASGAKVVGASEAKAVGASGAKAGASGAKADASGAVSGGQKVLARFSPVSLEAITAFFAFEVELEREGRSGRIRFVLRLPLEGAPEDRQERLLQGLLTDPDQVLRLLLFLLSEGNISVVEFVDAARGDGAYDGVFGMFRRSSLLEAMLGALARDPEALDEAAALIADLEKTDEGRALLPDGLRKIWEPIWECRQRERGA